MPPALICSLDALPPELAASVSAAERAYVEALRGRGGLPFAVSPHFAALAGPGAADPIRRQFFPDPREELPGPFARNDPLGEALHRAAPRLVHQYRDRALLLAGGRCAGYCRYCFRRVWLGSPRPFIHGAELDQALAYLGAHDEIQELLISGGDPLTAPDTALEELFQRLRKQRPGIGLRVCSRVPVTGPSRIEAATVELFRRYRPLTLAIHLNHPRELAPETRQVLGACVAAGIPVLVQTVLLRGINDEAATLAELFRECRDLGLNPYYLFQLDLAPGTAHFRLPLKQGLEIHRQLREILGEGCPAYAVDLPGGGGKIRLSPESIAGERETPEGRVYLLRGPGGGLWPYPADEGPEKKLFQRQEELFPSP